MHYLILNSNKCYVWIKLKYDQNVISYNITVNNDNTLIPNHKQNNVKIPDYEYCT